MEVFFDMKGNSSSLFRFLFVALFVTGVPVADALAQTTSTIEGMVRDANRAVIAGATIKVTGDALSTERTATSDSSGVFRITALPAGRYAITASHSGFATRVFDNVELTLNRVLNLDVKSGCGRG